MTSLDQLIASAPGRSFFAGPVDEATIANAEASLGIVFPADYRAFLATRGCGSVGSIEILGLGVPDTGEPNLLFVVRTLQEDGFAVTPAVLPFSPIGDGSYSALVTGLPDRPSQGTVVTWDPSRESTEAGLINSEAATFTEWLERQIALLRRL